MTTATRRNEQASRILADIHRLAQERIGLTASVVALSEWENSNKLVGPWLLRAVRRAMAQRKLSRLLARRYYNLTRAIGAGRALPNPSGPKYPDLVPLTQLLDDFGDVVDDLTAVSVGRKRETRAARRARVDPSVATDASAQQDTIRERVDDLEDELAKALRRFERDFRRELDIKVEVEDFAWPDAKSDEKADKVFEREYGKELEKAAKAADKAIKQIEKTVAQDASAADRLLAKKRIDDRIRAAGYEMAGIAGQGALTPGREEVNTVSRDDDLAVGWMRITGPRPCAFCAMLASRGAVYKSRETAGLTPGLGSKGENQRARAGATPDTLSHYHPNCMCQVTPVFTRNPVMSKRDKYFDKNWGPVTNGFGGKDALNAWRRWLTQQYKSGLVPDHEITTI